MDLNFGKEGEKPFPSKSWALGSPGAAAVEYSEIPHGELAAAAR